MVLKNQKMQKKKKKKRYSSSDSSDSSDDSSTSSSSSSDESPTKIRRKLKKLQKKGKLKSGRHRKGLAVIRNEIWPHDGVNARLAGKTFPTVESLTGMAFVAGILNPILDSEEFRKLEKKKFAPKMRQKLKILNELAYGIIRSQKEKKSMIIVVPSSDRLTACTATLGPISFPEDYSKKTKQIIKPYQTYSQPSLNLNLQFIQREVHH